MAEPLVLAVLPARLGSQRLPRKPLHPIAGRPLLEWVWRRVASFDGIAAVVVATDSPEVARACAAFGALAVMTSPTHESGTSRIGEVVALPEYAHYDVVLNVQGDEPFAGAEQARTALAEVARGFDIGTVAAPIGTLAALHDPAVVKVTRRADGAALYFSRSAIPHRRDGAPTEAELQSGVYLRHIGIYAYTPAVLRRWRGLPESALERVERLEQLRALEAGLTIGVGLVADAEGGVDTAADAARAEQRILAANQN